MNNKNKKVALILLVLLIIVVLSFSIKYFNENSTSDDPIERDDLAIKIDNLKKELESEEAYDFDLEERGDKSRNFPYEVVIVGKDNDTGEFFQGVLERDSINMTPNEVIVKYKGKVISTEDPIAEVGYPYVYYKKEEVYFEEHEKDELLSKDGSIKRMTFRDNSYSGPAHIVDEGTDYLTFGGYLSLNGE